MARLVTHEELKAATGFDNNAALEKCLRGQKVAVLYGKNGHVFTTLDAINNALGLNPKEQDLDKIEFLR
jgi:wobble nucleotide-excising tRNase